MSQPQQGVRPPPLTPQQLAMLQQLSRTSGQTGQPITPQQMQQAMAALQAQGGNANPQALMAAMRGMAPPQQRPPTTGQPAQPQQTGQPGQSQPQPQQQQQQQQQQMMGGAPANQAQMQAMIYQQQRIAQMMAQQQQQAQQQGQVPGQPGQMQLPMQGMGQGQTPVQGGISLQQLQALQGKGLPGSPARPPQGQPQQQAMPPPALPQGASPRPPQQGQQPPQQAPFSLTPQQRAFITQQQGAAMASPQFQQMPENQRQGYLASIAQNMVRMFSTQAQGQQQFGQMGQMGPPGQMPQQQQQQQQQMGQVGMGMPQQAQSAQQSPMTQQRSLSGSMPPQNQGQGGQPLSSLPQHMAPPRPASQASQRDGSPSVAQPIMGSPSMRHTPTPPPGSQSFVQQPAGPNNAPSPAMSTHSHHSQQQQQSVPHMGQLGYPSQSPMPGSITAPSPAQSLTSDHTGQPGGPSAQPTPQQQSLAPNMMTGMPNVPSQVNAAALQNLTPQQQQQMATAMAVMSQAAQNQQHSQGQPVQNPQQQGARPMMRPPIPLPNVNMSDFPFDWRLFPHLAHVNDPKWRTDMAARNPQLLASVQNAQAIIASGRVPTDVLHRMQQVVVHMSKAQAMAAQQMQMARPPGQLPPQLQQQLAGMAGLPQGAVPQQSGTPGQQRWQQPPGQAPAASPSASQASQASPIRPPPPHLPPPHTMPNQSMQRRQSDASSKDKRMGHGQQMPPPQWIPAHGLPPPARPPPHTAPDQVASASAAPTPGPHAVPVKEWEGAIRLDLPITNITPMPVNDIDEVADPTFGGKLPAMNEEEKRRVKDWLESDKEYSQTLDEHKKLKADKHLAWARTIEASTPWWAVPKGKNYRGTRDRLSIIWPHDKAKIRQQRVLRGRSEIRFTPDQLKAMTDVEDHVIPVRLDIEHDHFRLKDTFMWNCADNVVTPELFAMSMCDDFRLPHKDFVPKIVSAIQEKVKEYQDQVLPVMPKVPKEEACRGLLDPDGPAWEVFRRAREGSASDGIAPTEVRTPEQEGEDIAMVKLEDEDESPAVNDDQMNGHLDDRKHRAREQEEPMSVEEAMSALPDDWSEELRILVKVDIIVGTQNLTDTFEWDLNSTVTPEEFASSYCTELGLSGEFITALAHDIHEQILVHRRSLCLVGHAPNSGLIMDEEVRSFFLPPLVPNSVLRKEDVAMSNYTPIFATFTEEDILSIERERDRESKRKKRAGRARRGIILPDREPLKTHRTLLNPTGANGSVQHQGGGKETPLAAPTTSRRAAAIAAQANINLLAQDLPLPQPPSPVPQQASRKPKRSLRELSRASPMSARESSAHPIFGTNGDTGGRGDEMEEPFTAGGLRKRGTTRIDSPPDGDDAAAGAGQKRKSDFLEENGQPKVPKLEPPDVPIPVQEQKRAWHCKNCGVPEHLTPSLGVDQTGHKTLCQNCAQYLQRTGRDRPCTYTEDEMYHKQRLPKQPPELGTRRSSKTSNESGESGSRSSDGPAVRGKAAEDESSESSSEDDDSDGDFAPNKREREKAAKARTGSASATTPARVVSNTGAPNSSAKKSGPQPPEWAARADAELKSRYPKDSFVVTLRNKPPGEPELPHEWRMKCLDCPGRVYSLGPGETLQNFEVHLKNRAHMANRIARAGE